MLLTRTNHKPGREEEKRGEEEKGGRGGGEKKSRRNVCFCVGVCIVVLLYCSVRSLLVVLLYYDIVL